MNKELKYTMSYATDIRETFKRIRKNIEHNNKNEIPKLPSILRIQATPFLTNGDKSVMETMKKEGL